MSDFREPVYRSAVYSSVRNWRERLGRYRLVGSQCSKCEATYFPRRPSCLRCNSRAMKPYQCAHTGTVVSIWPQPGITRLAGYEDLPPRHVGMVQLDDGLHVETEIVGVTREQSKPGLRVRLVFRRLRHETNGNETYGYKFTPMHDGGKGPEHTATT
jgi:scaffold protein (connect acetoacetyl-CoA thiolase and HMG-CoA synthase)